MSSGCGDVLTLEDLKTAKKNQIFEAEVITGKAGGVGTGADIDTATNQNTGQTQKTLPAILRDMGFSPAGFDFTTGGTLSATDRDKVVYNPADNNWYSWAGALPKVIAPGTDPTLDASWLPRTDQLLRQELAAPSGALLVGAAKSYSELKTLTPTAPGQIAEMSSYYDDWASAGWIGPRGGKRFISVAGSTTDDGGFKCQPTGTAAYHWVAMVSELNLFDFGVKISDRIAVQLRDTTTELKRAVASAISNKLPLRSSLYAKRSGYAEGQVLYIKSGIDITGIKEMTGIYAAVYKPSEFTGAKPLFDDDTVGCGYVWLNMNCQWGTNGKIYGTSYGEQILGTITDYSMEGRNASFPMNGQLHCFSGSIVDMLSSIGSLGYGVRLADTYDSVIQDIRGLFSGRVDQAANVERPGWVANSYTKFDTSSQSDECNSLTIVSAVAHNCYDLAWTVVGTKNNLVRVHEEGTYVTTTWRQNPFSALNNNGFGYCNSGFGSLAGTCGNIAVQPSASQPFQHVFNFMGWGCSMDSFAGESLGCSPGFAVYGGAITNVRCSADLKNAANARVSIQRIAVSGNVTSVDDNSPILGGTIGGTLTTSANGRYDHLTISGGVTVSSGTPLFGNCRFNGAVAVNGGVSEFNGCQFMSTSTFTGDSMVANSTFSGAPTILGTSIFTNCRFTTAVTSSGEDARFSNCHMTSTFSGSGNLSNCRVTGDIAPAAGKSLTLDSVVSSGTLNVMGANINLYVRGGTYNAIAFLGGPTGLWQLFPAPNVNTTVSGWILPTATTGLGRVTANPTTNKIYTLAGGTWAEYTTH